MEANERLEVEDEDKRQRRIKNLLERTNVASTKKETSSRPSSSISSTAFLISPDEYRPHPTDPPSELLDRVRSFLPQIADSNIALSQQSQDAIDIENVGEDEEQYIEMNLGLGVFEYRKQGADNTSSEDSDSEHSSSESSDTDYESESSDEISGATSLSSRPIKPLPKRKRPEIVVLKDTSS